jgi:hypothetical protein
VSEGTRTPDRLDHNQELYQLSYAHRGTVESTSAARACSPHAGAGEPPAATSDRLRLGWPGNPAAAGNSRLNAGADTGRGYASRSIPWLWVESPSSSGFVVEDELGAKAAISESVVDAEPSVEELPVRAAMNESVVDVDPSVEDVSPRAASRFASEDWSVLVLELPPPPWWWWPPAPGVRLAILPAICCSWELDADEDAPFCVSAVVIDCNSDCCETPWVCAIEVRLDPDCSCCRRAAVLRPSVPETLPSTFCQLLCDCSRADELLVPLMGVMDMELR